MHREKEKISDQLFIEGIYKTFERLMYHTAQKYCVNPRVCEDIIQESLIKLIAKVSLLRTLNEFALANYIVTTVKNTSIDSIRKKATEKNNTISLGDLECDLPADTLTMDEILAQEEMRIHIRKTLNQLDPEDQWLLEGKYILGYDDSELARVLNCKPASIRMKLTRARRKALQLLEGGVPLGEPRKIT